MKEEQVIGALGALAQDTRLRILRYLVRMGAKGAAAGDIAKAVEGSPSRISFHLSTMTDAGLLSATRVSRSIIYTVDFDAMGQLMGYLVADCCMNDPRVRRCC